jgi:ribosomal protein S18 acetylase RimI-like enzyme
MQVRQATPADSRRIAQIHVETWRTAYRGQMPDAVLDALDADKRATFWNNHLATQPNGILVVESDKAIIGFCDLIPSRDEGSNPHEAGEIAAIYVHLEFWRKGAGAALCRFSLREARIRKYISVTLWVLASNVAAQRFYEAMGFSLDGATKVDHSLNKYELHKVRYRISV